MGRRENRPPADYASPACSGSLSDLGFDPEPSTLLQVWRRFDAFPMETLTKAWVASHGGPRQRRREEMRQHRALYGASGNCYDLAIWLMEDLSDAGIETYAVGDDLSSGDGHVAVVALDSSGRRFLCDLGDMWLEPVCIEQDLNPVRGFYPGAEIILRRTDRLLEVTYQRSNGKRSQQTYDLRPTNFERLLALGAECQAMISDPLVEMRLWDAESTHWEMSEGRCQRSTWGGLREEEPLPSLAELVSLRTGMKAHYVETCLDAITALRK